MRLQLLCRDCVSSSNRFVAIPQCNLRWNASQSMLRSNMQVDTIKHEEKERDGRGREKIIIGKLEVAQPIISVANLFPWQLLKKCTAWKHRNYDCINHTLFIKWNVHRAQSKQLNIEHESASQSAEPTSQTAKQPSKQSMKCEAFCRSCQRFVCMYKNFQRIGYIESYNNRPKDNRLLHVSNGDFQVDQNWSFSVLTH